MPRIGTGMLVPNPMVKLLRVSQQAYGCLPAAYPESEIGQDEVHLKKRSMISLMRMMLFSVNLQTRSLPWLKI
ncbi:hypothetical protein BDD12DRAFT_887083 [Trichophaea hybrida]|nr:hypothetical protein BDD12DRAFT_887083 [Trichophaea hybrida]